MVQSKFSGKRSLSVGPGYWTPVLYGSKWVKAEALLCVSLLVRTRVSTAAFSINHGYI